MGHVARTGHRRGAHRFPVWSPEGNRPLGRTRRRRKGILNRILKILNWKGIGWINLAQHRDSKGLI